MKPFLHALLAATALAAPSSADARPRSTEAQAKTRFPLDSWERPYVMAEPTIWFHEIFRNDGTPYRKAEPDLFRRLSAAPEGVVPDLGR